tara:strand:+ start:518 stop:1207 length:690 start_codon:yes stop_codon:yes gene_type:complete
MIKDHIVTLTKAIHDYSYNKVTYDFQLEKEITHSNMREVEKYISINLLSTDPNQVKDGLSNVIYWGLYTMGGRKKTHVKRFRDDVTEEQLIKASFLFRSRDVGLVRIKRLKLPEFSRVPLVSKVLAFLNPYENVVLDNKLYKIGDCKPSNVFTEIKKGRSENTISITERNQDVYLRWCEYCKNTADKYFPNDDIRAVDVERGIYQLCLEDDKIKKSYESAAEIVSDMGD